MSNFSDLVGEIADRLWRPQLPALATARTLTAFSSAELAWKHALDSGLIPRTLGEGKRGFGAVDAPDAPPMAALDDTPRESFPPTVAAVLTLAAGGTAVLAAEASVADIAVRLVAWGGAMPSRIDWFTVRGLRPRIAELGPAYSCAFWSVETALEQADISPAAVAPPDDRVTPRVHEGLAGAVLWTEASRRGLTVGNEHWPPAAVKGKKFADLPNPFEPLVDVWRTGYLVGGSFWGEHALACLTAPEVDLASF